MAGTYFPMKGEHGSEGCCRNILLFGARLLCFFRVLFF